MSTAAQIAEQAAAALVEEHGIDRPDGEAAVPALGWHLGGGVLGYEEGLVALVAKALEIDRAERSACNPATGG